MVPGALVLQRWTVVNEEGGGKEEEYPRWPQSARLRMSW